MIQNIQLSPVNLILVTSRDRSGSQVACSPQKIFFFLKSVHEAPWANAILEHL